MVRLTDGPKMTIAVYHVRKARTHTYTHARINANNCFVTFEASFRDQMAKIDGSESPAV